MKKILLLTIMLAILLASCGLLGKPEALSLSGTKWRLVSYGGKSPLPGKDMTAIFEDKGVTGSASCNQYFGNYRIKGGQISLEGLSWTEMACLDPAGIMEQEQTVMAMLSDAASYLIQGNRLEISTSNGKSLVFEKIISGE